ncbi:MAG: hypothetical protein HYZ81_06025 [Nitrospinae bacterium]|nr:hypothetical protein [Nitrospinota bacterium]
MTKAERDKMMTSMSEEQRAEFRRLITVLRAERRASVGRHLSLRALLASGRVEVPPLLRDAAEALMERDEMGPTVGEVAPDFCLKRLESDERVRLSSFQGKQPVAMVFGSYT